MSEEKKDEHGCVIGKERYDEESKACVAIPEAEQKSAIENRIDRIERALMRLKNTNPSDPNDDLAKAIADKVRSVDMFTPEDISGVMKDYVLKCISDAHLDDVVRDVIVERKEQLREGVRAGLGVSKSRPLTTDDIAYIRKMLVEEKDTDKRTPAPDALVKSTGPEGNAPLNPFEKMAKDFETGGEKK